MDDNKHLDKKIKQSFEGMKHSAPEGLWKNIAGEMNTSALAHSIDAKVKNSFDQINTKAPEHIWSGLNRQLNIDRVWNNINRQLDRIRVRYWTRMAGVAALLLLFLWFGLKNNERSGIIKSNPVTTNEFPVITNKVPVVTNEIPATTKRSSVITNEVPVITNGSPVIINKSSVTTKESSVTTNNKLQTTNYPPKDVSRRTDSSFWRGFVVANKPQPIPIITAFIPVQRDTNIMMASLPKGKDELNFPKKKKHYFEIGLLYAYNNTWLLNNETRKSFDKNTLISTSPTFAGSYGFVANYNLSVKNALSAEFYINAKTKQHYGIYLEGKYTDKKVELNYSKFTLLYQRKIIQYGRKMPSKYTVRAGAYYAWLKTNDKYYNGVSVVKATYSDNYSYDDYGFKLAIGQEKQLSKLLIGYGLHSEYGLRNIFSGNERMKADFDNTRNAHWGIYLLVKYKL